MSPRGWESVSRRFAPSSPAPARFPRLSSGSWPKSSAFRSLRYRRRAVSEQRTPSPRLRFAILRRDGFRCVYCGATPDRAELRVDHVIPHSAGGPTEEFNLVTACLPCNAGKAATLLEEGPSALGELTPIPFSEKPRREPSPDERAEFGRRGGLATAKKGSAYMRRIGKRGALLGGGRPRRPTFEEIQQRETLERERARVNAKRRGGLVSIAETQ
ncbi:MAG: HNH endonuclease [Desulfurellales bacterium]|nr:MAG: HNH endonuclease [Desulfurellales bacterium]